MDTVECPHCRRHCVPRLWHYSPFLGQIRYMRTQHICPFCGAVMYETGGGISFLGWGGILLFSGLFGYVFLAINFPGEDFAGMLSTLLGLAFWGLIGYKLYQRFKNRHWR